jgi:hypothetical protein
MQHTSVAEYLLPRSLQSQHAGFQSTGLGFMHDVNLPETFVVKCKCDRDERALATQILQYMPIRVSRYLKYRNAVSAIFKRSVKRIPVQSPGETDWFGNQSEDVSTDRLVRRKS